MAKSKSTKTTNPPSRTASRGASAMAVIAIAGVVVTGILLFGASSSSGLPYCSAGSGCEVVQNSAWSSFLGLPLALWGLATYIVLGICSQLRSAERRRSSLIITATMGFAISAYLTAISAFSIKAYCVYCLVSLALMAVALVISFRLPGNAKTGTTRIAGVMLGGLIALAMHADATGLFGGSGPVDPELQALAEHLDSIGAKFYGASWCPHCQQQKEEFGAAARFLPYVECAPNGPRGPRATSCEMRDIRQYPTWIINDRKIERLMTADALRTISGFKPPPSPEGADGG